MKVYIVVLLVLVAVAAASDVDKRQLLPEIHDLVTRLNLELASHFIITMSVCEDTCNRLSGAESTLCAPACELVVQEHKPNPLNLANELKSMLRSHPAVTTSVCEVVCHHLAGPECYWCPSACERALFELYG